MSKTSNTIRESACNSLGPLHRIYKAMAIKVVAFFIAINKEKCYVHWVNQYGHKRDNKRNE